MLPIVVAFCHSTTAYGGAEKALLELLSRLKASANIVAVLPAAGPMSDALAGMGITVEIVQAPWWTKSAAKDTDNWLDAAALSTALMTEILVKYKPSLCFTNTSVMPWGALASKQLNIPHVWFVHEIIGEIGEIDYLLGTKLTARSIGELSDTVMANGDYSKKILSTVIDRDKLSVFLPLLSLESVRKKSTAKYHARKMRKDELSIVSVGRVVEAKGQSDIPEALYILKSKGHRVHITIAGEAEHQYKESILKQADKLGVGGQIAFVDHVLNPFPLVRQSDLTVVTSRLESLGRGCIESMYLGVAVVGADNSGTKSLLKGGRGLLYRTGDAYSLAEAIEFFIDSPLHQRRAIAKKGMQYAEKLFEQSNLQYEDFQQKVINSKSIKVPSAINRHKIRFSVLRLCLNWGVIDRLAIVRYYIRQIKRKVKKI